MLMYTVTLQDRCAQLSSSPFGHKTVLLFFSSVDYLLELLFQGKHFGKALLFADQLQRLD